MGKVIDFDFPVRCIIGKVSKYSDVIIRRNRKNDYDHLQIYELHPYKGERSAAQQAQQEKFKLANEAQKRLTEEQKAVYEEEFKLQNKYKRLSGYIVAMELKKLANNEA